ncbi:hypothetical protein [Alcanivorax sp.]|jgi:hypothetical protein|uniref:hypothetical protein n=1 Tax=Alcanivorax sp. TaxID=1872427 RepID=UPI0032D8EC3E
MNIDLTKPKDLPERFASKLESIRRLCEETEFSEELVGNPEVVSLVHDIDRFCNMNQVIGVHYTRAIPASIRTRGLLVRNGEDIRQSFLKDHGYIFSSSEIDEIKKRWGSYFSGSQSDGRDGRIFFNFTEKELGKSGTKYLLGLYGGEQVSMCFELDEPIGQKLAKIGQPLVVKCVLQPSLVKTFIEYPWGKMLVSSYHFMVNPEACRIDQDGYQSVPVNPNNIVEIRALT